MTLEIVGLVIRINPYKENDALIEVLTTSGKVSFLARGILSPTNKNASSCLLYAYSSFQVSSRNNKLYLSQGKLLKSCYLLASSLEKMSCIGVIDELLIRCIDEDNHTLYPYVMKTLELLEQDFSSLTLLLIILANVIKESGYCLNYSSCVCCGSKKQIVSLSFNQGGYLCLKCVQNQAELRSEEYLNTYRYLFLVKAEQMDKHLIPQGIGLRLLKELFAYLIKVEELPNFKSLEVYLKAIETK